MVRVDSERPDSQSSSLRADRPPPREPYIKRQITGLEEMPCCVYSSCGAPVKRRCCSKLQMWPKRGLQDIPRHAPIGSKQESTTAPNDRAGLSCCPADLEKQPLHRCCKNHGRAVALRPASVEDLLAGKANGKGPTALASRQLTAPVSATSADVRTAIKQHPLLGFSLSLSSFERQGRVFFAEIDISARGGISSRAPCLCNVTNLNSELLLILHSIDDD